LLQTVAAEGAPPKNGIEVALASAAFQRLRERFGTRPEVAETGFGKDDLTVGDLVDILDLYLTARDDKGMGFAPVAEMVVDTISEATWKEEWNQELTKLHKASKTGGLDRQSPLYALSVGLDRITNPSRVSGGELSHHPGGITIDGKSPLSTNRYQVMLTNRGQQDNGLPIKDVFVKAGLPVDSNIRM
jgi:hypothetical protein